VNDGGEIPAGTSTVPAQRPVDGSRTPGPADGTAGAADGTAGGAAKPVPRPGHLGSLSVAQIVVAEAVILATLATATRGTVPLMIAIAASVLILVVFFARRRGRWWLEDVAIAWQHRRRRSAARDAGAGAVLAALRSIAPGLAVRDVSAPDGARVGVARDEAGWFTVVALTPATGVHQDAVPLPLDALATMLAAVDQPGVVLQLVTHTVPAPGPDLHPASPAGGSYRQLVDSLSTVAVPAHRETSLCVRLDARAFAETLLDHTADPETAAALVASLGRRVATSLRRLRIPCRMLDGDELVAALARSCDVDSGVLGDAAQVREDWHEWHSAGLVHRTYWLKAWPAPAARLGTLLDWVATLRSAQTSVAVILDPSGEGDIAVRALIRVAAQAGLDLSALEQALVAGVRDLGGELQALDGEQGPAVYATAPTGGGAG
jgi:type VII secretion protein EccE